MERPDPAQAPSSAMRRELAARGNRLRATVVIGRQGASDAVVAQVRRLLARTDLIKARVDVDRGAEADTVAEELARRVPCHIIKRIGKVVLLYRPLPEQEG